MARQVRNTARMSRGFLSSIFPSAHDTVSRLRQSATDAASDFSSRTNGTLIHAADAFRHEGRAGLDCAAAQVNELARATRELARQRPLTCLAAALALGCLIGALIGVGNQRKRR
jgi:ElaB/YqjD/DUF883 family membrane-anchored ribosome-binding protein